MGFKMLYNKGNFPFKHYPKGAGVHGHTDSETGDTRYHGKSPQTGKKSTYDAKKSDTGETTLVRNPVSSFGASKIDE